MPGQATFSIALCRSKATTLLAIGCYATTGVAFAQTSCERLLDLHLDDAKIVSATQMPASDVPATPDRLAAHADAHCEVRVVATPTSDSAINFALWLPPADKWNGKYLQKGSGGWGGNVYTYALITPLNRGYAAAGTDDGHVGDGSSAAFAVGHPEKLIDFGYRAIHETSRLSRLILQAFYGRAQRQAYFVGCSDGGREALMQAQRFPEDFNGIVAGAPAADWTHQFTAFVWNERAIHAGEANILPASKLGLLQAASVKACDAHDGVRDGIIEDPRTCAFDPATLACTGDDAEDCLTSAQIGAAKKIYSGPIDPRDGKQVYPGFEPGMEDEATTWKPWILDGSQATLGNSNFRDAVYEGRPWDWRSSDLFADLALADAKEGAIVNATNPDLRTFRAHAGKLIVFQGWGDAAVAPRAAIAYRENVAKFMATYPAAKPRTSDGSIDDFYRLFMAPGMSHCWSGTGPSSFGNEEVPAPGLVQDADHDVVLALDRWVVDGVAPERIVATHLPEKNSAHAAARESLTRPLCVYPKVARYQGRGSRNDAKNFRCVDIPTK